MSVRRGIIAAGKWPPVELISAQLFQSGTQNTTHALTIPSDCDCIVVAMTGYAGLGTVALVSALAFDGAGMDFSNIGHASYNVPPLSCQVDVYVMPKSSPNWPGTGARTLTRNALANPGEGISCAAIYYRNAHQTAPVSSVEELDNGLTSWTSSFSPMPDDLVSVCAYNFGIIPGLAGNDEIVSGPAILDNAGFGVAQSRGANVSAQGAELVAVAWVMA